MEDFYFKFFSLKIIHVFFPPQCPKAQFPTSFLTPQNCFHINATFLHLLSEWDFMNDTQKRILFFAVALHIDLDLKLFLSVREFLSMQCWFRT